MLCTFDQPSWFSEQKTDTNLLVGTISGTSRGPVGFSVNITQDFPCHRLAADSAAADSRGRRGAAGSAQVEGGSLRASWGSSTNISATHEQCSKTLSFTPGWLRTAFPVLGL